MLILEGYENVNAIDLKGVMGYDREEFSILFQSVL